ncbi:hypothetical protein ACIQM0_20205 [Streptomyces sp. NPDC091387]|uniref:hypothetical protein n=1 Tax=unclassified Streptomyces TaxID=2593676 RepID=UPI0034328CB6
MTTVVIIVAVVLVVAAGLFFAFGRQPGERGLQRRFGPEYDRTVARHDGDVKAARHELSERLKRHRSLDERPLSPEDRARYTERWTETQGRFVDEPHQAVTEADALLAELARERGFPDGSDFEEQTAALSVHHAEHINGYRRVHSVKRGDSGTEEMREAMIEARGLFDVLVSTGTQSPVHRDRHHAEGSGTS